MFQPGRATTDQTNKKCMNIVVLTKLEIPKKSTKVTMMILTEIRAKVFVHSKTSEPFVTQ